MAVPAKILLKSSTKMSLNERFSKLPSPPSTETVRTLAAADTQASAKNRRLAMQMENRPSVKAALGTSPTASSQRLGHFPQQQTRYSPQGVRAMQQPIGVQQRIPAQHIAPQQVSIQQRIGRPNVKARLSLPQTTPMRGNQMGNLRGRVGRGFGPQLQGGGRGMMMQQRGGRGSNRGGFVFGTRRGGAVTHRGGFNRTRGRGGMTRGNRGNQRGNRGNQRGNRGRGRGGGAPVSVEMLDNQLDEYMSKTRTNLDAELDAYMAEAQD